MFKIGKKTGYGLLALQYMVKNGGQNVATVREIAGFYDISQTLLAKILQSLVRHKLIESVQGAQGGYILKHPAEEIALIQIMEAIEGPLHVTDCYNVDTCCSHLDRCTLRQKFAPVQDGIKEQLNRITLADFIKE